jgi:prepilin-type N-terminal cleavage/methylation domain-containing protein
MHLRKGYTLIELLIFVAIFAVAAAAFVSVLVVIVRVQSQQSSSGAVQEESAALLQQLQYYVQNSSLVNIPIDAAPTSTLSLRMSSSSTDPTTITVSASGTVYLQQGSSTATPLTSNHVKVSNLSFVRHTNPPSHDTVSISFTMANNTANLQQLFSQSFQTAVTQVSAATFDSSLLPSSTATYSIGTSGNIWNSINGVIYFSGSNVGIGAGNTSPQAALDVSSGNIFVSGTRTGTPYGLKLRDPSGNCWLVTTNASGTLLTSSVSCGAP